MQVTISDWTRLRAEAYKRLSDRTKRDAARRLEEPPFRVLCSHCGHHWDQMAPEVGVAAFFAEELRCHECGDGRIIVSPPEAQRLQQIIGR